MKESPSPQAYIESILGEDQEETKENSAMRAFLKEKWTEKNVALVALPDPNHSPGTDFVY